MSAQGNYTKPWTPAERQALLTDVPMDQITVETFPAAAELLKLRRDYIKQGRWNQVNRVERALAVLVEESKQ